MGKKVLPCGDRILIQPITEETMLLTTEESREKPEKGVIVSLGDEVNITKFTEGDIVYYRYFITNPVTIDGKEYLIIETENILGKEV